MFHHKDTWRDTPHLRSCFCYPLPTSIFTLDVKSVTHVFQVLFLRCTMTEPGSPISKFRAPIATGFELESKTRVRVLNAIAEGPNKAYFVGFPDKTWHSAAKIVVKEFFKYGLSPNPPARRMNYQEENISCVDVVMILPIPRFDLLQLVLGAWQ